MSNVYKKRTKGSWNQGKRYKGDSEERQYSKLEISEDLAASDEKYLVPHKKKRKRNLKGSMEYWMDFYNKLIKKYEEDKNNNSYLSSLKERLRALKKEYKEKYEKDKT